MKIIVRQWPTTLLQLLSPLFCIGFVVILQYVAQNRANTIDIKPPFEIPFGGLFPINLPYDLIRSKDLGLESCLRNNKYAFTSETTSDDVTFARHLVSEVGVAVVPGSSFYANPKDGSQKVRFCFCKKDETLDAAAARLAKLA